MYAIWLRFAGNLTMNAHESSLTSSPIGVVKETI